MYYVNMHTLAASQIPTVSFETLWHVGVMDATKKKSQSYEGQGLSVSIHPEDWQHIAALEGPTWALQKPDNQFCDYHSLTTDQLEAITKWGVERGYILMREVYEVSWFDDEWKSETTMRFLDLSEATEEIEAQDGTSDQIVTRILAVATSDFPDTCVKDGYIDPHQILTAVWVQKTTDLDGVWWDDNYAPRLLSAPRGVIPIHKVSEWTATRVS